MKYFVTVEGREYLVEVDGDQVLLDGERSVAHLTAVPGTPLRHLLIGSSSLTLAVESAGSGEWVLSAQGTRHAVSVVDERTRHVRGLTGAGAARAGGGQLKAPMPGLVMRVLVEAGQVVQTGQGIIVLEAMKMENELRATAPGRVVQILARPGQAVDKGQILLELAPPEGQS
jgi:biotin carboxyl carrier protein